MQAPPQVLVPEGTSLQEAQRLLDAQGLAPPLLVKPLWTDGREGSHGLAVLHDFASLGRLLAGTVSSDLQPPLVVQQYVEHGGIIFKIYVLGGTTVVTKRPSIVSDQHLAADNRCKGLTQLPRISCAARAAASTEDLQKLVVPVEASGQGGMPPGWVTDALAASLRKRLGLQLFNFDMICPEQQPQQQQGLYYVVDINYFPGVDKLPGFEAMFVDFLISACEGRTAPPPASPRAGQCAPAASPFS